jgi:uncharacterized protein YjiS (DUF1127 family)
MRHERFDRDFRKFERTAGPMEKQRPGAIRRAIDAIMSRLANRRPDLRDFSVAQLRDIGLTRHDVERF